MKYKILTYQEYQSNSLEGIYIDWNGFQENVEKFLKKYGEIDKIMLKELFDNYSEYVKHTCPNVK